MNKPFGRNVKASIVLKQGTRPMFESRLLSFCQIKEGKMHGTNFKAQLHLSNLNV